MKLLRRNLSVSESHRNRAGCLPDGLTRSKEILMRIPVVDTQGIPLMPCTPAKARHLFKRGKARPKRNKLGVFYVQLCYEQEPDNQPLVAGIDPGSRFEGYSVVGSHETVLNLMGEHCQTEKP